MVRRAVAGLLVLVAAVLVHAVTPHHAWTPPRTHVASQPQDQLRGGPQLMSDQAQAPSSLHDDQRDPVALPSRVQSGPDVTGTTDGGQMGDAVRESRGATPVSHPATARDRHRPTGAVTPTTSTLQTFLC
ncbi:hypothetical protein ACFRKB_19085 [Streptomyces scopuliridis]|uniref:hypothetical protein n=1 Tax=Streptomyces scopuliridis TaxID=452529 RepID=UPI00369F8F5A